MSAAARPFRRRRGVPLGGTARSAREHIERRGLLVATTLALAGCASLRPRQDPPDLAGRLVVRVDASAQTPSRSFSADFDLRGNADRGTLRLSGPLGATLAEVRWLPGRAELADAQGTRAFDTLDAMTQELFGEALPLVALIDWLRGRPWPGAPNVKSSDGFEQLGWRIGLGGFADGLLHATRERAPGVSVRARLEKPV
jgi:outer membrane lipoprotein LolB